MQSPFSRVAERRLNLARLFKAGLSSTVAPRLRKCCRIHFSKIIFQMKYSSLLVLLPDVEFQFPSLLSVARHAPEFERADLGDAALQSHRQHRLFLSINFERHFERA